MNRRGFLKGALKTCVAGIVTSVVPAGLQISTLGGTQVAGASTYLAARSFRGTSDGKILESIDGGTSWQQITSFHQDCQVLIIRQELDRLSAQIGFQGHSFVLESFDGKKWLTPEGRL